MYVAPWRFCAGPKDGLFAKLASRKESELVGVDGLRRGNEGQGEDIVPVCDHDAVANSKAVAGPACICETD